MDNVFACNAPLSGLIMPKAPIAHNNKIKHFPNQALSEVVNKM